jgi:signal transduction histidine kinase
VIYDREKGEFLAMVSATVSHELRPPLNALLGCARMLRSCPADSPHQHFN